MSNANLLDHGDPLERDRWPALKRHFPLYEEFWRLHVFPLRDAAGFIRGDIDGSLELMAQAHYKCFISLAIADDGLSDETHPERTFGSLQNVANRARDVVQRFNKLQEVCTVPERKPDDAEPFVEFSREIALYRNFVHEDAVGMVQVDARRYLPMAEKLDTYQRWSRLRNADPDDFVPVSDILRDRFARVIGLLESTWQSMLDLSPEILNSSRYAELRPELPGGLIKSESIGICSNVRLG